MVLHFLPMPTRAMARNRSARLRAVSPEPAAPCPSLSSVSPADVLNHILKLHNRLLAPFSIHLEKRHRISVNEFRLLMSVGRLGSAASHEVAELTGVNTMAISRAVAVLKRQRRLEVTTDPHQSSPQDAAPDAQRAARCTTRCSRPPRRLRATSSKPCGRTRSWRSIVLSAPSRTSSKRAMNQVAPLFLDRTRPDDDATQD